MSPDNKQLEDKINFKITNVEVSCEDYTLLTIAGNEDLPSVVREKMNEHLGACKYHNSKQFTQSALGTPVTPDLEVAAEEMVQEILRAS